MADSSLVHLYTMINKHTKSCWFVGQQKANMCIFRHFQSSDCQHIQNKNIILPD